MGEHCLVTGHSVSKNNIRVLSREQEWHRRKVKEAIYIKQHGPTMNRDQGYQLPPIYTQILPPVSKSNTPFTLALLIRSETGFAPLRAFTLHQLIRINNLIRIKLNHLLEVVSHWFSLLRDQITSVDANRTRTKEEQIEINARGYICIYGVACQELSRSRSSARLSTKYHCKLSVAIL